MKTSNITVRYLLLQSQCEWNTLLAVHSHFKIKYIHLFRVSTWVSTRDRKPSIASPCLSRYPQITTPIPKSLCFSWAPRHEGVLREWRYSSTHSLTSALEGGEWSASRPGRCTTRERAPGTHWTGGWVGSRAVLDAVVKRKISNPRRESNPRIPIYYVTDFSETRYGRRTSNLWSHLILL
jgi:hypothetical protein